MSTTILIGLAFTCGSICGAVAMWKFIDGVLRFIGGDE